VEAAIRLQEDGAGASAPDPERRLSELEAENLRLRNAIADLMLDKLVLQRTNNGGTVG